jgi:hypothetical protein
MAVYGISIYGQEPYGYDFPPDYRVDPFVAQASSYSTINLSWIKPAGSIQAYRLVKNTYGYPVDQDDGEVLIDSLEYPGSQYQDSAIVPGEYYYYGFYVATDILNYEWVRSGWTACLAINNYDSYQELYNLIPPFYVNSTGTGDILTDSNQGNTSLQQFMQVFGWGIDLLRTQYDTYLNVNDPWKIPQSSLYNLANQMGININPDIHPYTLRKVIYYNATINEQRGMPQGIATEVSALTGWDVNLTIGPNMMLENDQSAFIDPVYPAWSSYLNYNLSERVQYENYWYQCIDATNNIGHAPTGTTGSNTWWEAVLSVSDNTVLLNSVTGNPDTWDIIYPSQTNGIGPANSIEESVGVANPLNTSSFTYNSLRAINNEGSAQTLWLRSVSRTTTDLETSSTTFAPDKYQAIADGIPVLYSLPYQEWEASTWYQPQQIVTYNGQPFLALKQSYNAVPPYSAVGTSTTEWIPLSYDPRYRLCVGAYCTGSSAVAVTPFCEWYDAQGNFISRIFSRNPSPGSTGIPNNLIFDSFTTQAGNSLNGRVTDIGSAAWVQEAGEFQLSPVNDGIIYQETSGERTYAVINSGVSNTQVGVTLVSAPETGNVQGIIFRWSDDNNYFLVGENKLYVKEAGSWTTLASLTTPFQAGDRMVVQLNGTSITILRNGLSVRTFTSSFNETATYHGIDIEPAP